MLWNRLFQASFFLNWDLIDFHDSKIIAVWYHAKFWWENNQKVKYTQEWDECIYIFFLYKSLKSYLMITVQFLNTLTIV